jgi:threonine/homoserine/homoserine lactone efflux protein
MKVILLIVAIVICVLNGYQAVTGRRVSRRPNRRSDHQVRVQSAIAAVLFGVISVLLLAAS